MVSRAFIGNNHPVFGEWEFINDKRARQFTAKKGKLPTESVYWFWWLCLRRSDKYRKACASNGKGMQKIYNDFGDVFAYDETVDGFKSWWYEPKDDYGSKDNLGAYLFAEPPLVNDVQMLQPNDIQLLQNGWDQKQVAVVTIPLNFTKRQIQTRLAKFIPQNKANKGKRWKRLSQARYPLTSGFSWDKKDDSQINNMQLALLYYDTYKENAGEKKKYQISEMIEGLPKNKEEAQTSKQILPQADHIDDEMWKASRRSDDYQTKNVVGSLNTSIKNYLNVRFSRKYSYAQNLIGGVENGQFPMGQRTHGS
jgi:hypothetical protein